MTTVYDFEALTINGKSVPLSQYQGKPMLIVNTASACGFTPQFAGLEELHRFGLGGSRPGTAGLRWQRNARCDEHAVLARMEQVAAGVVFLDGHTVDHEHFVVVDGFDGIDLANSNEFAHGC